MNEGNRECPTGVTSRKPGGLIVGVQLDRAEAKRLEQLKRAESCRFNGEILRRALNHYHASVFRRAAK
jgi:hypothetical protein